MFLLRLWNAIWMTVLCIFPLLSLHFYTQEDNADPVSLLGRDGKYPACTQPQQYAGPFGSKPAAD